MYYGMKLLRREGPSICFQNMRFLISQGKCCGFLLLFLSIWCCVWSRIFQFAELFSTVHSLYMSTWPWTWKKRVQKSRLSLEFSSTTESNLPVQTVEHLLLSIWCCIRSRIFQFVELSSTVQSSLSVNMALNMEEAHAKIKALTGIFINNRIQPASADGRTFAVVNPYNKQVSRKMVVVMDEVTSLVAWLWWRACWTR